MTMAKKKETKFSFRMDTRAFVKVWINHNAHPQADSWDTFIFNIFERFTEDIASNKKNLAQLDEHHDGWREWDKDAQYEFISERCYSKCISIKSKLKRKVNHDVQLPTGYLDRRGARSGRSRITIEDISTMFKNVGVSEAK